MENFIKEIIVLDEKAGSIIAKAEKELNNLDRILRGKKIEISRQIDDYLEKEFHEIKKNKETVLKHAMAEIDLAGAKSLSNMETEFEQNFIGWKDEIIASITGKKNEEAQGAL